MNVGDIVLGADTVGCGLDLCLGAQVDDHAHAVAVEELAVLVRDVLELACTQEGMPLRLAKAHRIATKIAHIVGAGQRKPLPIQLCWMCHDMYL